MSKIFNYPQFVEIRKGVFKWYAPVQEACKEYIRIDHQCLPEHVPHIFNFEKEEDTISSDVIASYKSTEVLQRTYDTNGYKIFLTNL